MTAIRLTPLDHQDADELFDFELRHRAYFEYWVNARSPDFYHIDAVRQSIDDSLRNRERDLAYNYLIKEADRIVGRINLTEVARRYYNKALLGYRIGEDAAGRGIASRAVALVLEEAFQTLGLWRIEATVRDSNMGSARVLQKNGFSEFGRSRQSMYLNDAWHDLLHFECHGPVAIAENAIVNN
jgi:ribosomal-protein-alanine N-acetyltransferase